MLLSDTHFHTDEWILRGMEAADEIWHAGDIGDLGLYDTAGKMGKPFIGVYGNIDGAEVRSVLPLQQHFRCEGLNVFMQHIAGYPGSYNASALAEIRKHRPDIFICGHSHILKVQRDPNYGHLHINPGAAGLKGFHQIRTYISFTLEAGKMINVNIHEKDKHNEAVQA